MCDLGVVEGPVNNRVSRVSFLSKVVQPVLYSVKVVINFIRLVPI